MEPTFGIIFDFDGPLVDTERLHHQAFAEVLAPLGLAFSWEEYVGRYIGFDDRGAFRTRFADFGRELTPAVEADMIRSKSRRFDDLAAAGAPFLTGARELVLALAEAGAGLAICSGARRSDIDVVLDGSGLQERFHAIVTADDVRQGKPDPEGFRLAAEGLRRSRADLPLAAAEDTPDGLRAARAAGLPALAVTTTFSAEVLGPLADLTVAGLDEVTVEDLRRLALGQGSVIGDR